MTVSKSLLLLTLLVALAGCATPVPFQKSRYVGEWDGEKAHLVIEQEGYVRYERFGGTFGSNSVEGVLKGFKGDNFQIGVGPISQTIVVNKAPYLDGDDWKMVVDGMELIRIGN